MSIHTRLAEARKHAGLTQRKVAAQLDIKQSTIWRYEAGHRTPTIHILHSLAQIYEKPMEWFLEEETPASEDETTPGDNIPKPAPRWKISEVNNDLRIDIECDSPHRPNSTHHWYAAVIIKNDGYIHLGETTLESVENTDLRDQPQAILKKMNHPIQGQPSIPHDKFEKTCQELADLCKTHTDMTEAKLLPLNQQPGTTEYRLVNCRAVIDRLTKTPNTSH